MRVDDLAPVWKALSDPTRRRLLDLLRERPRTTGELCAQFPSSRFAVMKHLTVLEEAGLVFARREGRQRWNHLNAAPLRRIHERWIGPYRAHWSPSPPRPSRKVDPKRQEAAPHDSNRIAEESVERRKGLKRR